jgi:hypothetical protein
MQSQIPIIKSNLLFKFFYMFEKEWQETYKDVQGTTFFFNNGLL